MIKVVSHAYFVLQPSSNEYSCGLLIYLPDCLSRDSKVTVKARSHLSVAELSAAMITIKLQQLFLAAA